MRYEVSHVIKFWVEAFINMELGCYICNKWNAFSNPRNKIRDDAIANVIDDAIASAVASVEEQKLFWPESTEKFKIIKEGKIERKFKARER